MSTLFDIEMRVGSSWFIPFEALVVAFFTIFGGLELSFALGCLAFVGILVAYIIIAKVPLLKWVYLTITWFFTFALIVGISFAVYRAIAQIPKEAALQPFEIGLCLLSLVVSFLIGLIRGASFRYYTEDFL